jgi:mannose-6-phosphate isomerase-like protein (cupin superfamily)
VYEWQSDTITVRLTGAQTLGLFTLTEDLMKPIFNLGRHLHRTHAETFHMLEGEVEFSIGSDKRILRPGTTLHVPPNTPHGLRVLNGKQARMLMLYSPAGFDEFLVEMKKLTNEQFADEEFMKKLNEKYDIIQLE